MFGEVQMLLPASIPPYPLPGDRHDLFSGVGCGLGVGLGAGIPLTGSGGSFESVAGSRLGSVLLGLPGKLSHH
jgi:hypothetical protein